MSKAALWQKTGSTTAYRGFVTITRDTYSEPDNKLSDWDIIAGNDSAATLAFTAEHHELVLFEQFRVGPGRTLRELPGGYLNDDELPVQAALRELGEETGYCSDAVFYGGSEWWAANSPRRKHVVIAAEARLEAETAWDQSEAGRVILLPLEDLFDFLLGGELTDAGLACRGLLALARSEPGSSELSRLRDAIRGVLLRP